ncbi:MAG: NADH-quinone oxidoreductase subunit N, partial [Ignavibacteria bacterium]|nr:NADH-quinone oxidoreductase subunit N [Ignavibacteria bacterium]
MPVTNFKYYQLLPFIIIGLGIIISVIIEISTKKSEEILPWFSILLFFAVSIYSLLNINNHAVLFGGMIEVGGKPAIFNFIFNIGAMLIVMSSIGYLKKYGSYYGEYYIIILCSVLGMLLMIFANDLLILFIGLELMSICFYVLVGFLRKRIKSNESALKYFLLGVFITGFLLYGISLMYGAAGTTKLNQYYTTPGIINNTVFIIGFVLFAVGFFFKMGVFPFHMWIPDVYEGAPTLVTGLMSTSGKIAA